MEQKQQTSPLLNRIYFYISLGFLIFSVIAVTIGIIATQTNKDMFPVILIEFFRAAMLYQIAHFFIGIFLLIYYARLIKKKILNAKITKTIAGILFTPLSFFLFLTAGFLLVLSRCS